MYQAPAFRHVDEPVRLLGLEIEDWVAFLVVLTAGLLASVALGDLGSRMIAVAASVATAAALRQVKRGKPRGYLTYWVHRYRLTRLLPRWLRVTGALPAPAPWRPGHSLLIPQLAKKPYCVIMRNLRDAVK